MVFPCMQHVHFWITQKWEILEQSLCFAWKQINIYLFLNYEIYNLRTKAHSVDLENGIQVDGDCSACPPA